VTKREQAEMALLRTALERADRAVQKKNLQLADIHRYAELLQDRLLAEGYTDDDLDAIRRESLDKADSGG
jgi:hypothetical protein